MNTSPLKLILSDNAAAWQQIDGETVLLDLRSSEYLGVNESGTVLWSALAEGTTESNLVGLLADRFGLSTAQARADVDTFLRICNEHGLIEVHQQE